METQSPSTVSGVPPIVLLVEDDAETCDLYETALAFAGLWVAKAADAGAALEYAVELRPDSVLMDIAIPSVDDGLELARALRESSRVVETPIVAVTGVDPAKVQADAGLFTTVFYKPVQLDQLVRRVKWLSLKSSVLRERSERAQISGHVAKSTKLRTRSATSQQLLNVKGSNVLTEPAELSAVRACPKCRKPLHFAERRALEGTMFDYYRPCRNGCGLFCYDHSRLKMITLVA